MTAERQRIDKWLWHARVVRTRSAAAELAARGHVRVNGERITAASSPVKAGDVLTVALDRAVRVMKVSGFAERRGSSEAARSLFEDLGASSSAHSAPSNEKSRSQRDPGSGRPSGRERRALDRLRSRDGA